MVNLELYRVFYTVAKCGSLTKAAELLYISQPAVSQAIKQLEGQLGTSLFNRTHRGMELSVQGGKLIFKDVEEALKLLENAENKLTELKMTATGTIRVGATDSIFSHILAEKIVDFHDKYPAVRIELVTGTSPETLEQIKDNRVDIGFVNLPLEDKDVHFMSTVAHLNDIFVAGRNYSQIRGKELQLNELQSFPLLMIESNTVARKALAEYTRNLGVTLNPDIEVATWDFMLKLVVRGMGVGCIPREYCKKELESGEIFEINVNPSLPARGVGLAVPKNMSLPYALKEFVNMFTD